MVNITIKVKKHETYILKTLSYLHLLPSNDAKKHLSKILQYLYSKKKIVNDNDNAQQKVAKKALAIIDKHIKE